MLLLAAALGACSEGPSGDAAGRGRNAYLALCTSCHATDPAQPGPVGPPVKGASRAVLEAKVVRGQYPQGYAPKRPTAVMPPMPQLANSIDDLAAYLK
jgi:mono/diheme cytochrome c family protein